MKNNLRLLEIVLRILRQKSFKEKLCSFGFDEGASDDYLDRYTFQSEI